jgi:site-specific DNA-methyltransferase (adenine-specific)
VGKEILGSLELNRIYQIDCVEGMKLLPDNSVDLILTDIPYNEANRKSNGLRNLDKEQADILTFDLQAFLEQCKRVCKGSFYIFCGFQQLSVIDTYFRENKISRRCIVWEKTNPSPMNAKTIWLSGIEVCVYGKKPKATFNSFYRNTVLKYPSGRSKQHPTEKPLKLFEELLKISTNEGDVVLDTCIGSGTTAVAALKNNRRFIGFETESQYIEIANQRIESTYNEIDDQKLLNN